MSAQTNKLLGIAIFLMTSLISACSSTNLASDEEDVVLSPSSQLGCSQGFIRPPGVSNCINISDIIEGNTKALAPVGICPSEWRRLKRKDFCLPRLFLIACGSNTFSCKNEENDSFRVIPETPKCSDGVLIVTADAPMFGENGELYLGTRVTLACGPPSKIDPVDIDPI